MSSSPRGTVAVSYIRVSSEAQAGEMLTSLDDQRAALARLAERFGVAIVQEFSDPGVSGATVAKRPGMRALLTYCSTNKRHPSAPGYVLVLNDSRWGRFDDPDEAAALRFRVKQSGWIVRMAEGDDIEDGGLRSIVRAVGSAEASKYRANLRANAVRGRMGTARLGFWTTRAPFGYWRQVVFPVGQERLLPPGTQKARGEKIKLTPGPEAEVELVRQLFARYLTQQYSLKALCRFATQWCTEHGIAGRAPWDVTTLRMTLENDAYAGDTPGRRRTAERMERGDYFRHPPEYVIANTHPALIARPVFEQVRELLASKPIAPRPNTTDYRVRGLVTCALCGGAYVGAGGGTKRLLASGERIWIYIDQHGRDGRCGPPAGTVAKHVLEGNIIRLWAAHVRAQTTSAEIRAAFAARLKVADEAPSTQRTLERERAQLTLRMQRLVDAVASGTLRDSEVREKLTTARAALDRVQRDLRQLQPAALPDFSARLEALTAQAANLETLATSASGPVLRSLLQPWVHSMTFDRRNRELRLALYTLGGVLLARVPQAAGRTKQDRTAPPPVVRIYQERIGQAAFQKTRWEDR